MTNEEAIKEIQRWLDGCPFENTKEAFNLAIKALETGEIYITGKDYSLYIEGYKDGKKDFEPKKGEWICATKSTFPQYQPDEYKCPFCNVIVHRKTNYCEYCGADMRNTDIRN